MTALGAGERDVSEGGGATATAVSTFSTVSVMPLKDKKQHHARLRLN